MIFELMQHSSYTFLLPTSPTSPLPRFLFVDAFCGNIASIAAAEYISGRPANEISLSLDEMMMGSSLLMIDATLP